MMKIAIKKEDGITELRVIFVKLKQKTIQRKQTGFFAYLFRYFEHVARKLQLWTNRKHLD